MTPNLDQVAKELYGKIQTRFPDIKIADETAQVLSKKTDIPNARFFEFEYKEHGEVLGTIAIALDEDDGIVIQAGGDLVDKDTNETHHGAYKFIRSFRDFARRNMLNFEVNNMGKSNLDQRDYEFNAKSGEEQMMESKMFGTSKVSYQDLGETRLVVRHSQPVNPELAAGRTMHIESIYIENAQGERFRYPVRHLNGARAMAQHIAHGGNPYDNIGQHVVSLSEEMAKLRMFKGYVSRTPVVSEAMGEVNDKVIERIEQVKKEIHQLQRPAYYEEFAESFSPVGAQEIPEDIMLDWVDRLTERSFKEELKDVFPYIYKLVAETNEINPEDILGDKEMQEGKDEGKPGKNFAKIAKSAGERYGSKAAGERVAGAVRAKLAKQGKLEESDDEFKEQSEFSRYLDSIVEGLDDLPDLDSDEFKTGLKDLMSTELKGNPNIVDSVKALYPDDTLLTMLKSSMDVNPEIDARGKVMEYFENNHSQWFDANKDIFSGSGEEETEAPAEPAPVAAPEPAPAPAPEVPPAPEAGAEATMPPAEVPMAEAEGSWKVETPWKKTDPKKNPEGKVHNLAGQALKKTIEKAKKAGATKDTKVGDKTIAEMIAEAGLTLAECGMAPESELPGNEINDMMKFISGFWNREKRNFTVGGTGLRTKLEKQFAEARPEDLHKVGSFIQKLDPSSEVHQQDRVLGLAGIKPKMDMHEAIRVMESVLDGKKYDFNL